MSLIELRKGYTEMCANVGIKVRKKYTEPFRLKAQ